MKLQKTKTKNDVIYYLAKTIREGKKTKTVNVKRLGTYNSLISEHEDPESYCRSLVEAANKEFQSEILNYEETVDFTEILNGDENESSPTYKNIGYLYLNNIFDQLKIRSFIKEQTASSKIKYDLTAALKLLVFSRILDPHSKKSTFDRSSQYLASFDLELHDIYRSLDVISKISANLQAFLYKQSSKIHTKKKNILYYDVTNFFFEIEYEDDENGLRKYGLSKEHRPNPIVQMGLFIDGDGIPVAFNISSGNKSEKTMVLDLEKKIVSDYANSNFIFCSDAGLNTENIKRYNSFAKRSFIITQSLKKLPSKEQDLFFQDLNWKSIKNDGSVKLEDYRKIGDKIINEEELTSEETLLLSSDMIYKDFPYNNARIIITFSIKSYVYQKLVFNKQLQRANKIISQNNIIYNPNDVRRLVDMNVVDNDGQVFEDKSLILNNERVTKECKYHGFYACATNLEDDVNEIIKINKSRWMIEDCFRTMKTTFKSRPVYVRITDRIKAHFLTCFVALLIFSLLKTKLNKMDLSNDDIINTLKNMNVDVHELGHAKALYTNSKVLIALEDTFGLGLNKKAYSEKFIKKIKTQRHI